MIEPTETVEAVFVAFPDGSHAWGDDPSTLIHEWKQRQKVGQLDRYEDLNCTALSGIVRMPIETFNAVASDTVASRTV